MGGMWHHGMHWHGQPDDGRTKPRSAWAVYRRFAQYLKPYTRVLAVSLAVLIAGSLIRVAPPWIIRTGINNAVDGNVETAWYFVGLGGVFLGIHLVQGLISYLQTISMRRVEQGVIRDLRNGVFRHLQDLSLKFYDNRETGELMSRLLSDVNRMEAGLVGGLVGILRDLAVFAWLIVLVFYLNWRLALLAVAVVPVMGVAAYFFNVRARAVWRRMREKMADISVAVHENISGTRVVRAFGREDDAVSNFKNHTDETYDLSLRATSMMAVFGQIISLLNALGTALVLAYGGYLVLQKTMDVGDLVAFMMYTGMLYGPVNGLVRANQFIQRAAVAAERVFDLLDTKPDIDDAPDAVELQQIKGNVEFSAVSFAYGDEPVLHDVSFAVRPGEVLAIVGPSGAGKTTIGQLIPRLYEVTSGAVLVDGHDVRAVKGASLRRQISMVSQDIFLFSGTVRENIAYGRPGASDEDILAAANAAHVDEFAQRLPDKYETRVGERGVRLSEGQKQRIAIARALLKNAPILILDEPTSNVDTESERLIQESLDRLMRGRTTLVIAHRLSTVIGANRIAVLEHGRILDIAPHAVLLQRNELYAKLYNVQFDYKALEDEDQA